MRDGLKMVNGDCLDVLKDIESDSIDCILTDPPYKYLKGQKLDREFEEAIFFPECKRVLKKDGFIVLFGRGTSFYRWNTRLADLGFVFKEEIVWDKAYNSSPVGTVSRVHETISIHSSGGIINKVKVPYLEMKGHDIPAIIQDINRLKAVFNNTLALDAVISLLDKFEDKSVSNSRLFNSKRKPKHTTTAQPSTLMNMDRSAAVVSMIANGMNEKTIIRQVRDHYKADHPTKKPVGLIERLLNLVTKKGDMVLDPFAGSFSTGIACLNTGRHFIGVEIDPEYCAAGVQRMKNHQKTQEGLFDE